MFCGMTDGIILVITVPQMTARRRGHSTSGRKCESIPSSFLRSSPAVRAVSLDVFSKSPCS
jgi:hypothetical protein